VLRIDGQLVVHLTARIDRVVGDLTRPAVAPWLWTRLRAAFPGALAATLMPDHPHVVTPASSPAEALARLNRLLGHLGRRLGVGPGAGRGATPRVIESPRELARQVRYLGLNAPRAGLVRCPSAWLWSTHRDLLGATVDPWISLERLAAALGDHKPGFVGRFHAYCSADPSCAVAGTPLPVAALPQTSPSVPLEWVAEAAAAATRRPVEDVGRAGPTRALFVALAREQGWQGAKLLAQRCNCTTRTIRRLAAQIDPARLPAGRLCLGDVRLRDRPLEPGQARMILAAA
jgi:hypothetical protein